MKKLIVFVVILAALGTGGWAYYQNRTRPEPQVTTVPVSRGDVIERVQATGTLEAVTTVDVGTQVSGVVQELFADFNSIVRKGQVIARLDPSILQVQIESQTANVVRAEADLERLKVALADAQQKFERAKAMFAKELVPRADLEAAELAVKSADAQIKSSEASLTQSKAALNHLTKLLANVLGPEIRVNAVAPGLVDTPWTADWDAIRASVRERAPLQRSGTPDDIARAALLLTASSYSTGEILLADGGINLR